MSAASSRVVSGVAGTSDNGVQKCGLVTSMPGVDWRSKRQPLSLQGVAGLAGYYIE